MGIGAFAIYSLSFIGIVGFWWSLVPLEAFGTSVEGRGRLALHVLNALGPSAKLALMIAASCGIAGIVLGAMILRLRRPAIATAVAG